MTTGLLRKISVTYLLLPNLLFALGWFKPAIGWTMAAGLLFMLFREFRKNDNLLTISTKDLFLISLIASFCTYFSGVEGLTSQTADWLSHNQKYYDLFKNDWPIYFPEVGQYACYYFGYYLVPAFFSKLYGELLPSLLVCWTFVGYVLAFAWLYVLLNRNLVFMIAAFLIRGTGHLIFFILLRLHIVDWRTPNITPTIRSLFEQGHYCPNQLIPTMIVTSVLLFHFLHKKQMEESAFLITLVPVWAVFPTAALGAIYVLFVFQEYFSGKSKQKVNLKSLAVNCLVPGILVTPTIIFFLSSQNVSNVDFLFNSRDPKALIIGHLTSLTIDLILFYFIFYRLNKIGTPFPKWLANVLLAGLFLLSLIRLGKFNDLFFRGSLPFCILIIIMMLNTLDSIIKSRKARTIYSIAPLLFFVAFLAIVELTFRKRLLFRDNKIANYYLGKRPSYRKFAYDTYPNTYQTLLYGYNDEIEANQYLGKKGSLFEKYLCKNSKQKQ